MEMESIDYKRTSLKPGSRVRILSENWFLNNKEGIMLDPNPVEGSSRCIIEVEGESVTLPIHDVFEYKGK